MSRTFKACVVTLFITILSMPGTSSRELLQSGPRASGARAVVSQQKTSKAINQAVRSGAKPAKTQGAARTGQTATRTIASPSGLPVNTAALVTGAAGGNRGLLQASRSGAGASGARATIAQQQTAKAINQAVRSGAKPVQTRTAAVVGTGSAKVIAAKQSGINPQTAVKVAGAPKQGAGK